VTAANVPVAMRSAVGGFLTRRLIHDVGSRTGLPGTAVLLDLCHSLMGPAVCAV
jgi:hypothetical protein